MTFQEAADLLGKTKPGVHWLAFEKGVFKTIRRVGPASKPIHLLRPAEVMALKEKYDLLEKTAPEQPVRRSKVNGPRRAARTAASRAE
jgi:hypothetical protein